MSAALDQVTEYLGQVFDDAYAVQAWWHQRRAALDDRSPAQVWGEDPAAVLAFVEAERAPMNEMS